ncbi:four and a half LIM domains protein 2-like [Centruroides vittatus]|uniref:four and a half LIM domains protein 2-like n=1 Tax=Centruroides vittatus TaxID=120091 RepID=UPI00350F9E48
MDEGQPCLKCKSQCPGYKPHAWRAICDHCKCMREWHEIRLDSFSNVRDRMGLKDKMEQNGVRDKRTAVEEGYSWVPPGLAADKIQSYFARIPSGKVPKSGTPGEKYREKQLIIQLPDQDFSMEFCKFLGKEYQQLYIDFNNERDKTIMDIAYVKSAVERTSECYGCGGTVILGDLAVVNPKLGEENPFHPSCFVCSVCEELLVDLICCTLEGRIYCQRHYAEQIRPRCAGCDELIFGECTKLMSKYWHPNHVFRLKCEESLSSQKLVREDRAYFTLCYKEANCNICHQCGRTIGIHCKNLSYKDKHWHEDCFVCNKCRIPLIERSFAWKNIQIYCEACYHAAFASRCEKCGQIFRTGTKMLTYRDKQWHKDCVRCVACSNLVGNKGFVQIGNDIHCNTCYQQKFGATCVECHQIVTTDGIVYGNKLWHSQCFCCTKCLVRLEGRRFALKDDKLYCVECFGNLFAERCSGCNGPVIGISGTRYTSFEGRKWHNDCFFCVVCKASLVEKNAFTDGTNVLCPGCTKPKIMV